MVHLEIKEDDIRIITFLYVDNYCIVSTIYTAKKNTRKGEELDAVSGFFFFNIFLFLPCETSCYRFYNFIFLLNSF